LGNFVPETKIVDIPFLFRDYDHARKVMDGPIGQDLLKKMPAKGLIGLAWTENGFRHMTNNKRPINTASRRRRPEGAHDGEQGPHGGLQDLRPAAHADGLARALHRAAAGHGRRPGEPHPGDPVGQVLAGAEAPVADRPRLFAGRAPAVAPVWNKLSDADKKVFTDAAKAAAAQRKKVNDDEANGIASCKKDGMQVVEKVDGDSFRKAVGPAYRQLRQGIRRRPHRRDPGREVTSAGAKSASGHANPRCCWSWIA
jgi:hypothetical protein